MVAVDFKARLASLRRSLGFYGRMSDERALQREHASVLFYTILLFTMLGCGSATLFTFALHGWTSTATTAAFAMVIGIYALLLGGALRWRQRYGGDGAIADVRGDVAFIAMSVRLLFGLGVAWGVLINLFAARATAQQHGILIGLTMALVSAPMLGVPLSAALAFFVPIALFCSVVILVALQPIEYVAVLSFLGFVVFAFTGLIYMNKSIMDRLIARVDLEREHEIVRVFLREYEEVSSDWLWETDAGGRLRKVGPQMAQALQRPAASLEAVRMTQLQMSAADGGIEHPTLSLAFSRRTAFRDLSISVRIGDTVSWLSLTGHPVHDPDGQFQGFRGIGSDVTQARAAQQQIEFLASHDGLTGLLNRKTFVAAFEVACHAAGVLDGGGVVAMLLVDLDDFKEINDDLGHLIGDQMLIAAAERLTLLMAPGDSAARIGGDEFAMLLHCPDAAAAGRQAGQIAQALQSDIRAGQQMLPMSASIGVALHPDDGSGTETLMKRADLALYTAKSRGKGGWCLFETAMETEYLGRLRMLAELGTALDQGQIFAEFQPIVDIVTGQLMSTEALARWNHPVRGMLNAGEFIAVAESSDLIERLGECVLRFACQAASRWADPIPVAVNLSPKQLRNGRFVATLQACLAEYALPPERLILEVTETVFLGSSARTVAQLDVIRSLGVRLVLDDFGTGYSSLTYLRRFDVDGIKIDASFTRDLPGSHKVCAIVRTIARLASDMNIYVTAEGVETPEQLRWLRTNGIAFAQGFLLGRSGADPRTAMRSIAEQQKGPPVAGAALSSVPEEDVSVQAGSLA